MVLDTLLERDRYHGEAREKRIMWKRVFNDFSAGEAAQASGVSQTLQRDWRRRGILPDRTGPQQSRFEIDEILRLAALKTLSEVGLSVKTSQRLAVSVASTAFYHLERLPGAVAFDRASSPAEAETWWIRTRWNRLSRYIITPLPERDDGPGRIAHYEREDLTDMADLVGQDGSLVSLIFDIGAMARKVHEGLPRPVLSIVDER